MMEKCFQLLQTSVNLTLDSLCKEGDCSCLYDHHKTMGSEHLAKSDVCFVVHLLQLVSTWQTSGVALLGGTKVRAFLFSFPKTLDSLLPTFPWSRWYRNRRRENFSSFVSLSRACLSPVNIGCILVCSVLCSCTFWTNLWSDGKRMRKHCCWSAFTVLRSASKKTNVSD